MNENQAIELARKAASKVKRTGDYKYLDHTTIIIGRDEQGYYVTDNSEETNGLNVAEAIRIAAKCLMGETK